MQLNYRQRFTLVISAYTFLLVTLTLIALWVLFEVIESGHGDELNDALNKNIAQVLIETATTQQTIKTDIFDLYYDNEALPEKLKGFTEYGFYSPTVGEQLIVGSNPSSKLKYYLVIHIEDDESSFLEEEWDDIFFVLLVAVLASIIVAFIVLYMAKKLTSPVIELQEVVKNIDIDSDQLPILQREDEIGELSNHFSELVTKLRNFAQRERDFTRFSSHELRTPVTVIRGNLDLLEQTIPKNDLNTRVLQRLDTAVNRMNSLIEVFLWLGREDEKEDKFIVEQVNTSKLKLLIEHVLDTVSASDRDDIQLQLSEIDWLVKPEMLSMVVDNLLRNALRHGDKGIMIIANSNQLSIKNDAINMAYDAQHGVGLQIVQRISDANNWQFTTQKCEQQFTATLTFY